MTSTGHGTTTKVEQIEPGIYIEEVAHVRKIENQAEIWFNIHLTESLSHVSKLEILQKALIKSCKTIFIEIPTDHCDFLDRISKKKLFNIRDSFSRMFPKRSKRALLGFVGEGMSYLYGTMSESEKRALENRVLATESDGRKTMATLKNFGQLMEKTIAHLEGVSNSCFANNSIFENINENFNKILKHEDAVVKQIIQNNVNEKLLNTYNYISDSLSHHFNQIHNTLNSLKNGIMNSELITLDLILNTLKSAKLTEKNYEIPFGADFSLREFNKLTRFGVIVINETISVIFLVPVVNIDILTAYQVFAVPQIEKGLAKSFAVDDSWVVVDKMHEKQFKTTKLELKANCLEIREEFLCKNPLTWTKKDSCELAAINSNNNLIESLCPKIIYAINSSIIIPLHGKTRILILNPIPTKAKFIGTKNRILDLNLANIVSINETGSLFVDDAILDFSENEIIQIKKDIILDDKIENDFFTTEFKMPSEGVRKLVPIVGKKNVKMSEINELAMEWSEFNHEIEKAEDKVDIFTIVWITALVTLITLLASILFIYLRWFKTSTRPEAAENAHAVVVDEPQAERRHIAPLQSPEISQEEMQPGISAMGIRQVLSMQI